MHALPLVRGRIPPEVESTGRAKQTLDVLLNLEGIERATLTSLDELEQLRIYLASLLDSSISIRLFFSTNYPETQSALQRIGIECLPMAESNGPEGIPKHVADRFDSLKILLATALRHNADCIVSNNSGLLPYVEEFGEAGVLLTSADFLLRYAQTFARGHDVPWAFAHKVWFESWTSFYQLAED